jgi:hypothetical protein
VGESTKVFIELLRALFGRRRRHHHRREPDAPCDDGGSATAPAVPDVLAPAAVVAPLAIHLAGTPADGSDSTGAAKPPRVIWVDEGDEVIVHLDSLRVEIAADTIVAAIDLETAETGRGTIVVPFAVGSQGADDSGRAGLVLLTEDAPRGPAILVARWGTIVQDALFASLLALSETHALERGGRPRALYVRNGNLHLDASPPAT